jgi:uncharacterized membrane protein
MFKLYTYTYLIHLIKRNRLKRYIKLQVCNSSQRIAELFLLMIFFMIIILIADVIKILVSGVMEAKISIIGIVIPTAFGSGLGFIAFGEHRGADLPPITWSNE